MINTNTDMRPLTRKQKSFVERIAIIKNGYQSAVDAGYSPRSARTIASQLLTKSNIKKAIEAEELRIAESSKINPKEIQSFWQTVSKDDNTGMGDRLRASELLAKSLQMFKDNQVTIAVFQNFGQARIDKIKNNVHRAEEVRVTSDYE